MTTMLTLALLLATQAPELEPFPPSPFDRVQAITIDERDAPLAGHGPAARVSYTAEFAGTLHLWTRPVGGVDLFLRVESPSGELVREDADSGAGGTPYLELEVEPGRDLVIVVALSAADDGEHAARRREHFDLCAIAAPETVETRAAADVATAARAEVKRLREAKDLDGARERVAEAVEALLAQPGASVSELISTRAWDLGFETHALSMLASTKAAWMHSLRHRLRTLPPEHRDLQVTRLNLALTLKLLGDLAGCCVLEERVLEIYSRTLPDDHPDLTLARSNLAVTIRPLGDLARARALLERVLEVRSRALPEDHPELQWARSNLSVTLATLGDHAAARALQERVLEVFSRTLPEDHPDLQAARANLSVTLSTLGDLAGARALQEHVLEVRSRTLQEEHPHLQLARANLAATVKKQGDLAGARELEERVLQVYSLTLPEEHPNLQKARLNLASTVKCLGDLAGARALEERVLEILTRTLPDEHPDLQKARVCLTVTILWQSVRSLEDSRDEGERDSGGERAREHERAAELLRALAEAWTRAARDARANSSGREAEERCASSSQWLDFMLSVVQGYGGLEPATALQPYAFAYSEATRNAAIASSAVARLAAGSEPYTKARTRLAKATDELAQIVQRRSSTSEEFRLAREEREAAERALLALGREHSGGRGTSLELDVATLSAALGPGDAAIAYRAYVRSDLRQPEQPNAQGVFAPEETSLEHLCAFVVRARDASSTADLAGALTLVDLGPIEPIRHAVARWHAALDVPGGRGLGVSEPAASVDHPAVAAQVRRLAFDPLARALGGSRRIVLVLDGPLHLVPFDALPAIDEGKLLGDVLRIETRATLGELLDAQLPLAGSECFVGLGGASFDLDDTASNATESVAQASAPSHLSRSAPSPTILRGGAFESGFTELPGTLAEVEGLGRAYGSSFGAGASVSTLSRADATKEALLAAAPRARWLHIATHGWSASSSMLSWEEARELDTKSALALRADAAQTVRGMSPMLLCGLALAGANSPEDAIGRALGLLTADELSSLDLSNCEMAVLSACDTARGEMKRAGQGVASLQKALQVAGARSVITSLWKVPDEATKELMLDFYRRLWVEKKPKHQALWEAKTKLREAKDERGEPKYTTRDWAAWVLTGSPD